MTALVAIVHSDFNRDLLSHVLAQVYFVGSPGHVTPIRPIVGYLATRSGSISSGDVVGEAVQRDQPIPDEIGPIEKNFVKDRIGGWINGASGCPRQDSNVEISVSILVSARIIMIIFKNSGQIKGKTGGIRGHRGGFAYPGPIRGVVAMSRKKLDGWDSCGGNHRKKPI